MSEDPLKSDFPIDWEDDQYVTRREFFRFMTLASGGLAVGTTAVAVWSSLPRAEPQFSPARIASVNGIPPGGSLPFTYPRPNDICILVRRNSGEFVAYSRRCTHLSCPVDFEPDKDRLYCPCHNGAFSLDDGRVLQGPPPHPLPAVVLEIRGDEVWAVGVKSRDGERA
jgi:Rieske Fe-S protein